MQVLKFGGTSVGSLDGMLKVMDIIRKAEKMDKTIVVVSAFSGVTNNLLKAIKNAKNGNKTYVTSISKLKQIHFDRIKFLNSKNTTKVTEFVEQEIDKISELYKGVFLTKSIPSKTEAEIVSVGEKLSSYILANALDCAYKDSRELIKTTTKYTNATINFKNTNQNISNFFNDSSNRTTILAGFISSNKKGETTTLGRGGSDYSAAIYAAALNASKLEIWTDVNGMFTANPTIVQSAFSIKNISYEEAMELSHFGAKVIYPPTIIPVLEKNIAIHIKNTFDSLHKGTLISSKPSNQKKPITGISHIDKVALITIEGNGMIGIPGFAKRLFDALYFEKINIKLITQASSEHSICIAIDVKDIAKSRVTVNQAFEYEIITKKVRPLQVEKEVSIIALVGDQMKSHQGLSGKLFSTLGHNNVNVRAIAQGASEKNISIVIASKDVKKALNSLHARFFENQKKQLNLFIIGVGNVGMKLLEQIQKQKSFLLEKLHIDLRVIALANSKLMLFKESEIDLNTWQKEMKNGEKADFISFFNKVKELNLRNSIFIDNTANQEITNHYTNYLKESIAIVTCNKIACSSEFENYTNLQYLSRKYQAPFLYETNVGAGLPVIDTLKNLIASGDQITEIKAVLSGSLNFIFNNFNLQSDDNSFYNVVKKAGIEGYTEPDPRIDLSGVDVMRKILILARESGLKINLDDIDNETFLPKSSLEASSIADFMETLKKESKHFEQFVKRASANNCQLKYVASLTNGSAKVSLQEIPTTHPFYNLEGSDNIVLFYTNRYVNQPLIIKGAGAGADVTASGLFADIIRIGNS